MRTLGIDPGIGRLGWGIIEGTNQKQRALGFGCLETDKHLSVPERLLLIHQHMRGLFKEYKPDVLAVEELFFGTNTTTAFVVGQARGVVLLTAAEHHVPAAEYGPMEVKMALTGYGRAEKAQIGQMVKLLLRLETIPKPDDTADALAIALTHMFTAKFGK